MNGCTGTWDPSPEGLYCETCDTERRWNEGPPYYHGKPRVRTEILTTEEQAELESIAANQEVA